MITLSWSTCCRFPRALITGLNVITLGWMQDDCHVGDHLGWKPAATSRGLKYLSLHRIEDLQGPLWHPALAACTEHWSVDDHKGLDSLLCFGMR